MHLFCHITHTKVITFCFISRDLDGSSFWSHGLRFTNYKERHYPNKKRNIKRHKGLKKDVISTKMTLDSIFCNLLNQSTQQGPNTNKEVFVYEELTITLKQGYSGSIQLLWHTVFT